MRASSNRNMASRQGQHRVLPLAAGGRAVIAMTAVRNRAHDEPGNVTDHSDVLPPTDVMVITSLPLPLPLPLRSSASLYLQQPGLPATRSAERARRSFFVASSVAEAARSSRALRLFAFTMA